MQLKAYVHFCSRYLDFSEKNDELFELILYRNLLVLTIFLPFLPKQ